VKELQRTIDASVPRLLAIGDQASARRAEPGKWSPREIIGHLIDSASNNHQRFVRVQFQDDLVFAGYDQYRWVACQGYQEAGWHHLIALWAVFNLHLARVMTLIPDDVRARPHLRHNLHQLAFEKLAQDQPATLDYFMADYVAHLQHHLRQILGPQWDPGERA
jgi:hypothetical protein